jgi:hypothetical protein
LAEALESEIGLGNDECFNPRHFLSNAFRAGGRDFGGELLANRRSWHRLVGSADVARTSERRGDGSDARFMSPVSSAFAIFSNTYIKG